MSGICGVVRLDGAPASEAELRPVWAALAHRGPHGGALRAEGAAALGFQLLATRAEAPAERQPFAHAASGAVIVADARLDNREELAAALGLDPRGRGNGELILEAYLRWGDEAPLHLVGDFAFAIWDAPRRRLFAARDRAGMRQLHYALLSARLFVFATDERAVLAHAEVPSDIDEHRIADFLEDLEGADLTSTFHRHVTRLPPGHRLLLERGTVTLNRYWQVEPEEPLQLGSDAEFASAFLHHLEQAVACRCEPASGSMLSGGLDSSAITAVMARLSGGGRPALSAVSDVDPACEETAMIRKVQAACDVVPHEVTPAAAARDSRRIVAALAGNPFDGSMVLVAALYAEASRAGLSVILDGAAADVVLGQRNEVARLLRMGRLRAAWAEAEGRRRFWRTERLAPALLADVRAAFLPDAARRLKAATQRSWERATAASPVLSADFARRIDIAGRRHLLQQQAPSPRLPFPRQRAAVVGHHNLVVARERYDRVASSFGVEARDPFTDLRLVRFALALPPEQLARQGWTKYVLRSAMAHDLPEDVRWRRGKAHLGRSFIAELLKASEGERLRALHDRREQLLQWVRPDVLRDAETELRRGHSTPMRVADLACWLAEAH